MAREKHKPFFNDPLLRSSPVEIKALLYNELVQSSTNGGDLNRFQRRRMAKARKQLAKGQS